MLRNNIKKETVDIHRYVESLPIMKHIMSKTVNPESYINYLNQIYYIYLAIENNPLYLKLGWNIFLSEKHSNDIKSLESKYSISTKNVLPITKIYCSYIENIKDLNIIAAHCYVRYMADLMGGKIIARKLPNDWSKTVYDTNRSKSKIITDYINEKITNEALFSSQVHNCFLSHASILHDCEQFI